MKVVVIILVFMTSSVVAGNDASPLFWPPAPDTARVAFLDEIKCEDLTPQSGFLGKLARLIGGGSEDEKLLYPFDVAVSGRSLYMVFQNVAALVEIDPENKTFKLHRCEDYPMVYPVSLCNGGEAIFITDPEAKAVYRFARGRISRIISDGLVRPTGITALPAEKRLYIIDTGDHRLKIFDYEGRLVRTVPDADDSTSFFHYPTFAAATDKEIFVNDGLNYLIREFDPEGRQIMSFGKEGDGPGCFARPKGLAVDSDGHIYVVDNMFDNVQVFDNEGRLLLVIGSTGREKGQFWSPAGIDIVNDTIYVADMFNNRIQLLQYLGGRP